MGKEFNNAWSNLSEEKQREINLKAFEEVDLPAIENMLSILNEIQPLLKDAISAIDEKNSQKGKKLLENIMKIAKERMDELTNSIEKSRNNK